jgi:hypothetical protein
MYLKIVSKWVVIAGTLLIWTVKFIIRPFVHIPHPLKPFVGFAPNLIGSFLLPFGACWFFQRFFKLQTRADLTFTCSFGLLLVIINEYLQLIPIFGRTFDYLDIFSSVVGVFCGHLVFGRLMSSQVEQLNSRVN